MTPTKLAHTQPNRAAWGPARPTATPFSNSDGPDWYPAFPPRIRLDKQTFSFPHRTHGTLRGRKLRCLTAFTLLAFLSHQQVRAHFIPSLPPADAPISFGQNIGGFAIAIRQDSTKREAYRDAAPRHEEGVSDSQPRGLSWACWGRPQSNDPEPSAPGSHG